MIKIVSKTVSNRGDAWLVVINGEYFLVQVRGREKQCSIFLSNELGEPINGKFVVWDVTGSRYNAIATLLDIYDDGWREQVNGIQWVEK